MASCVLQAFISGGAAGSDDFTAVGVATGAVDVADAVAVVDTAVNAAATDAATVVVASRVADGNAASAR